MPFLALGTFRVLQSDLLLLQHILILFLALHECSHESCSLCIIFSALNNGMCRGPCVIMHVVLYVMHEVVVMGCNFIAQ